MKDIERLTEDNTETTVSLSQLESLPQQVIKEQLLEPFFDKRELNALRQLRASSKTLQIAVDAQDEHGYRQNFSSIKQIAVGAWHNLVLLDNGKVYAWGENGSGELGLGDVVNREHPVPLHLPSRAKQVAVGAFHSSALLENGEVYVWGGNGTGQLGIGTVSRSLTPKLLRFPTPVKQIFVGPGAHSFALLENGQLYTWGSNKQGQLGLGDKVNRYTPELLKLPSPVKKIVGGFLYTIAILENGDYYFWGMGHTEPSWIQSSRKDIVENGPYHFIIAENGHFHVLHNIRLNIPEEEAHEAIHAWKNQKTRLNFPANVKQFISGENHHMALLDNGDLYGWSDNEKAASVRGLMNLGKVPKKLDFNFCEKPLLEKTERKVRSTLK